MAWGKGGERGDVLIICPGGKPFGVFEGTYPCPLDTPTSRRGAGGDVGKRVPSGHNRRRRLAPRSSGKQQAGRTAVRTAPIVCPEESPLLASTGDNFAARNSPWRGLTRRLRREGRACSPMGRSHFSFGGERKVCKRKPAARRLQRRPAPLRTAAKPCATLVLGYALHGLRPFLALVGLRPPLVAGFVLR